MKVKASNPVLPLVKEVRETRNLEEVAALLASQDWVAIAATMDANRQACLFSLGRVN